MPTKLLGWYFDRPYNFAREPMTSALRPAAEPSAAVSRISSPTGWRLIPKKANEATNLFKQSFRHQGAAVLAPREDVS
jgi:hypothetical protein